MMWRRSLSLPGLGGLPAASQASRDWPPFQARVVKPKISTLTPQRSSVRARMSAQVAATVIGQPRHDALQMRELLVEVGAQPLQLVVVAQIFGGDDLVEFRGKGVIFRAAR